MPALDVCARKKSTDWAGKKSANRIKKIRYNNRNYDSKKNKIKKLKSNHETDRMMHEPQQTAETVRERRQKKII